MILFANWRSLEIIPWSSRPLLIASLSIIKFTFITISVKVLGKGKKERVVFFSDRALEYLERYLDGRREGPVILSVRAPHQGLKKNAIENIIRKIAERAGINKRVFPHLLRHTLVTRALNKGMPLPTLCDIMGHCSTDTTKIYAKNSQGKLKYEYDLYAAS